MLAGLLRGNSPQSYLADTRQHVDGRTEVPNMKDRQCQLDVSVMPDTFRRLLSACQTFTPFFIGSLEGSQLHIDWIMKVTYHAGIQGSLLRRGPDILLIRMIQVRRRDFNFGYTDNILGCERLKLNVFSTWSTIMPYVSSMNLHPPRYIRRDIALVVLIRRPEFHGGGVIGLY
jgi:hypothetical protein